MGKRTLYRPATRSNSTLSSVDPLTTRVSLGHSKRLALFDGDDAIACTENGTQKDTPIIHLSGHTTLY